jgi:2,3-bisphosphoglycerate-dependent phosphoglycerate mutase
MATLRLRKLFLSRSFEDESMMQVLLIRHGQSANNAQPEHLRVADPDLTELGKRQASATAAWLQTLHVDYLYCSPFLRALETARPISESKNMPVHVRADLFEQGGCYSGHEPGAERGEPGLGRSALAARYPGWHLDETISETGWWGRDYETQQQAEHRAAVVARWLSRQASSASGLHVLVIHADFKRLLVEALLGENATEQLPGRSLAAVSLFNAGASSFTWEDGCWRLRCLNSTEHLAPDLVT